MRILVMLGSTLLIPKELCVTQYRFISCATSTHTKINQTFCFLAQKGLILPSQPKIKTECCFFWGDRSVLYEAIDPDFEKKTVSALLKNPNNKEMLAIRDFNTSDLDIFKSYVKELHAIGFVVHEDIMAVVIDQEEKPAPPIVNTADKPVGSLTHTNGVANIQTAHLSDSSPPADLPSLFFVQGNSAEIVFGSTNTSEVHIEMRLKLANASERDVVDIPHLHFSNDSEISDVFGNYSRASSES